IGTYSHNDPTVTCETDYNGYGQVTRRTITVDSPVMFTPRDFQQVSYQLFLYRWNATSGSWVYDGVATSPLGGTTGSMLPESNGFTISVPGKYYRVAISYKWFWNGVPEVSRFD